MRFTFFLSVVGCAMAAPAVAQPAYQPSIPYAGSPSMDASYNIDNSVYLRLHGPRYGYVRQLIQQGDYARADKMLNGIMGDTSDREARFLKGITLLAMNNPAGARRYFEKALPRGRSGHPGAMSGLALAEIRLGNADAARDLLQKLEYQKQQCAGNCDRAAAIDQAIGVVTKGLT
jgi:TolA-binding protein